MDNCDVCSDKYNKTTRKKITCYKCNFNSCLYCYKQYFSTCNQEANCMNCKEIFKYCFLYENFPRNYINKEYKEILKNVLYNNETSFFPETLPYVENIKQKEKIIIQIQEYNEKIKELYSLLNSSRVVKQNYIKKCMTLDCKGFLNKEWECSLCENKYCKKCFEKKEEEHICNEENIKTAELIKKQTKSCPSCGINIYKIDGCDQFFCTNCNTCFDWKTLQIYDSKTRIHNPHYFEYLTKNTKNIKKVDNQDIETYFEDNIINQYNFEYYMSKWTTNNLIFKESCYKMFANMNHFINEIQIINNQINLENRNLRINFLLEKITTEQFKKNIEMKYKNSQKLEIIVEKIEIYVKRINKCIVNTIKLHFSGEKDQEKFIDIHKYFFEGKKEYTDSLKSISKIFNCSVEKYFYCPF